MIVGYFDSPGRPYAVCRLIIPRFRLGQRVAFLVDTGADGTCLHPRDALNLGVPFSQLGDRRFSRGVGGWSAYFREPAFLSFRDGDLARIYEVGLLIVDPDESGENLHSLLGRYVLNHWHMEYDHSEGWLEFTVRPADRAIGGL